MAITKEQAVAGGSFHYSPACGPKRTERWRSNGKCKVWVTRPDEFRLPVKFGLHGYYYITHDNAGWFHRAEDCPHGHH